MYRLGALLLSLWTQAWAVDLHPECYIYYEQYNASELTYEEVGQLADKMHEKGCWPVLQGLLETEQSEALPPITDCTSLVPHIVQMTVDQATANTPAMMKLSSLGRLGDMNSCLRYVNKGIVNHAIATSFVETCAVDDKVIHCIGHARFPYGKKVVRFYLERDSDGDEFIGYSSLE